MADIGKARQLLDEAIRHLPNSQAWSSTRIHIRRAISEMLHESQKQARHAAQAQQQEWPNWQIWPQDGSVIPPAEVKRRQNALKEVLGTLDGMLAEEQKKLDDLDNQKRGEKETEDDQDMGPLLG